MAKSGFDKFQKDLAALESRVRNKVIRQAQKAALKPLAADIKGDLPVDTGELKKSVKVRSGKRKAGFIVTEVNISTKEEDAHTAYEEFGTRTEAARPVIRPEAKKHTKQVVTDFAKNLDKGIQGA